MSFHILLGAFPIPAEGDSLEPVSNERVGALRGHSRGGAFVRSMKSLLDEFPGHDSLRFLADEEGPFSRQLPDPQTRWTVLDRTSLPLVIESLDRLLDTCTWHADVLARCVSFGADAPSADEIRLALSTAHETADPNAVSEDGESAEFVFAVLVSLRGLLRRALTESARVAIFMWSPS